MKKDVIIIGGGAAGLMCAIEAGKRGRSVLVIEQAERLGKKILISGGGRCNFTNVNASPENFLSANPDFCKSALARYTPAHFIALVEKHGIAYHEKKLGQLFCDGSARQIVAMLRKECAAARVEIRLNCRVVKIVDSFGNTGRDARATKSGFQLQTNQGEFECKSLVVATGGLSIPKMGATDFGYRAAKQFGLKIVATAPGLVPFTLNPAFVEQSGVSVDTVTSCNGVSFRENILLTHRGLSGPAILQISNYCGGGESVHINLLPEKSALKILKSKRGRALELSSVLSQHLPRRFVTEWCARFAPSRPMHTYSVGELETIARSLHNWEVRPSGTEGYAKAEVTLGGVDTDELSSQTMEARRVRGLFFIGEVVDVTGWLGGYNFQWAWASGFAAGLTA
jgi:predicted Rossmann fold flavoprotein